ncbi:MAG: response regulator [Alphaproteobacteria bacterium]|nr:response regulator [Alphaproteobacteria bacterium]MBU0805412.1 response regulator [Alphaproteobacteria bacterium]MBU0873358.1 response regulator [Alphaproteobacteria bacterium]MBU1401414.1 response regulator [Alphaproteobacteria bacterium]MBU1592169.1 response regulator [Alphaproteobacteria bacterium]
MNGQPRSTASTLKPATDQASRPLVLIVDDDAELRETLKDLFGSIAIAAQAFATTRELLDNGLPDRPSCLVLDLRLPGSSGLELQKQLAAMGSEVPIVFITGHADVSTSVRAMKAGAVDFLPKPFRDQELLDAVTSALRVDGERRAKDRDLSELRDLANHLTPREIDVLRGVSRGLLNKQIAYEIGVSEITVKMHRSSAGRKLKVRSVVDMLRKIELLKL